jgi:hypothetical protein
VSGRRRWPNRDPIGIDGGANPYSFVHQAPTYNYDPQGLIAILPRIYLRPVAFPTFLGSTFVCVVYGTSSAVNPNSSMLQYCVSRALTTLKSEAYFNDRAGFDSACTTLDSCYRSFY